MDKLPGDGSHQLRRAPFGRLQGANRGVGIECGRRGARRYNFTIASYPTFLRADR
ncbi:MAG: hypothetical protein ABSE63_08085 [Thermoguttaceae bacterium]